MTKPARDRERDRAVKNRSKSREPGVDHAHDSTRFQIGDDDLRDEQKPTNVGDSSLSFVRVAAPRHESHYHIVIGTHVTPDAP